MEKEKRRQKELQDKIYEERAAKLWELEYQKKIDEQKQIHLKKVINQFIYFIIVRRNQAKRSYLVFSIYFYKNMKLDFFI